jgi:hypothetical protein
MSGILDSIQVVVSLYVKGFTAYVIFSNKPLSQQAAMGYNVIILIFYLCSRLLNSMVAAQSCIQAPDNIIFQNDVQANCTIGGINQADSLCQQGRELEVLGCPPGGPWTSLKQAFWVDADGDGYGASYCNATACAQQYFCGPLPPAGYAANNLDCDDTNALIFPGTMTCLSDTSSTYNLQTIWPPTFNITIPNTICRSAVPGVKPFQWGHGLSLSDRLLFMGASCANIGMLWVFDPNAQAWLPLTAAGTLPPQDTPFGVILYANTGSVWQGTGSEIYIAVTYGHSLTFSPGTIYRAFDLWNLNPGIGPVPALVNTASSILKGLGNPGSFHVFGGFTVGGNPGPGTAGGGSVNDSRAAVGTIISGVYTEWSLCNCTTPNVCPVGWSPFVTLGLCEGTNNNLGTVTAIDRFDGRWAAVAQMLTGAPDLHLYMFWFNTTDSQWWFKQDFGVSITGGTIDAISLGLYNGLMAVGYRNGNLADISPSLVHNASVCDGLEVGWARVATLSGFTWTLSSSFLYAPDACTGMFCGESLAVSSNNRVVLGCPEYLGLAGAAYGRAYVFDVANVAYPNVVAQYVAPVGQRGTGMADVGFGQFVDMDETRIVFSTDFVAAQGLDQVGRGWITRCTNHTTCPVPVVPVP